MSLACNYVQPKRDKSDVLKYVTIIQWHKDVLPPYHLKHLVYFSHVHLVIIQNVWLGIFVVKTTVISQTKAITIIYVCMNDELERFHPKCLRYMFNIKWRCCILTTIYNYTHIHAEAKSTIMTNEHTSLEKHTSHTLFERVAKGLCVRGELETEQTATYWPHVPLSLAALISHSAGCSTGGPEGPTLSGSWFLLQPLFSN